MTFAFSPAPGPFFPGDAPAWLSDIHFWAENTRVFFSLFPGSVFLVFMGVIKKGFAFLLPAP
ncbi:hypothetical protein [Escherichia coli]|uniref:hypothetical protein n=1 Tax=Escherichia coli TaxID=562 RepID=UPI0037DDCB83